MTSQELRNKFKQFFESKHHAWIPSASLVPENDPTVLFTTAGMHPLVPYLLGQSHPSGKRLASVQKCVRTGDIEEVGDTTHHTFFEMLGNWSLGDYFKKEAIEWSFEFLTGSEWLNIPVEKLAVSVFVGDEDAPFDQEAHDLWRGLGIAEERIARLPKKHNWWGPAGQTGPCGPDTEMFYWRSNDPVPAHFDADDDRWVEIWNDVFMQYSKTTEGNYEPLAQKNVDTGLGLIRVLTVMNGLDDNYKTDLFWPIIQKLEEITGKKYEDHAREFRIIADHIVAATMAIIDGAEPSNKGAGYVIRRLIRRSMIQANELGVEHDFISMLSEVVITIYSQVYKLSSEKAVTTKSVLEKEELKFRKTLKEGLKRFDSFYTRYLEMQNTDQITPVMRAKFAFDMFQTYGFPLEMVFEEFKKRQMVYNEASIRAAFDEEMSIHQNQSRTASAGMFKGGLADHSEQTTKYHTATHMLQAALRNVLGEHVLQKGSNITAERLRFDFSHPDKMTEEQIKRVEDLVNEQISRDLTVSWSEMTPAEAKQAGALGVFDDRYGNNVKVYSVGDFSKEICGGPHVEHTGTMGHFKITKEEAVSAGVRRIKAVLE